MGTKPHSSADPQRYHGMTWPVRLVVYFFGGVVVMLFALLFMRGHWNGAWWVLWIPPATGLLGVLFPQAADWLFARIGDLVHLRR